MILHSNDKECDMYIVIIKRYLRTSSVLKSYDATKFVIIYLNENITHFVRIEVFLFVEI